jgi:hypothetical protein
MFVIPEFFSERSEKKNIRDPGFNQSVTIEQLKNFPTKDEINDKFDKVLVALDSVSKKIEDINHIFCI